MLKPITTTVLAALVVLAIHYGASAQTNLTAKANGFEPPPVRTAMESDRINDGLIGPVRRVRTEIVTLSNEAGRVTEGKRAVIEMAAYDIKGHKTENQYFPIAGATLTGKEVYKYDEKGNISEMTMFKDDGSLLSREIYKYEFDFGGNWNRMTTSIVGIEGGKIILEPSAVTYRSIMYYLDENMRKMMQPVSAVGASQTNMAKASAEAKLQPSVLAPPASKRTAANRKTLHLLPASSITAKKLNAMDSPKALKVSTNAHPQAPVVMLDSEPPSSLTNADPQAPVVMLDSEPPSSLSPTAALSRVSGGVLNGTAVNLPSPVYPDNAKRMRITGIVSVDVVVDETGKVTFAQASRGPALLRDAAVQAAKRARFSATMLSGHPVSVSGVINYNFALSQ